METTWPPTIRTKVIRVDSYRSSDRRPGFSEASCYLWRSKFGGMSVPDAKRLRELETENTWLKKLLAEQAFENDLIKDALRKSGERTGLHCMSAPEHPHYQRQFDWCPELWPDAMRIGRQTISLPLSSKLSSTDIERVTRAVKSLIG